MADTQDLIDLYSKRILALAADIPHSTPLAEPQAHVMKRSPLCGSTVTADVVVEASASLLGSVAIGMTRDEIAGGREALAAMLKKGAPPPDQPPFDELKVLEPARDYRNRHASIMLAWDAVLAAMDEAAAS